MASTRTGVTSEASTSADKHRCEMCNTVFGNETTLFSHYHDNHKILNNIYACKTCDYRHRHLGYVRAHAREDHSLVFTWCKICQMTFNTLYKYNNHLQSHKSKTSDRFVCNKCKRQDFIQFSNLVSHYTKKHLKIQDCEMCNDIDDSNISWLSHCLKYHKGHSTYLCNKCDYASYNLYNLKIHASENHSYIVKYCVMCDTHFTSLYVYKTHLNVHKFAMTNVFRCGICNTGEEYCTINSLIHHHTMEHLNKPCNVR